MSKKTKEVWIPIDKSNGMFSSEWTVIISTADGSNVSLFIDKDLIKEIDGIFRLKVTVVDVDESSHKARVLLPKETFETSSRWVDISDDLTNSLAA